MPPDSQSRNMRYLVIGCGSIGQRHTRNLRRLGVKDILAYDPDSTRLAALAQECGIQPCHSLEEAYEREPDAVLICAPTSLHLSLARQALTHNCHIFVEKPLSHTLDGVRDFLVQVRSQRRVLLVGYNLRFDPLLQQLEAWLEEHRIGHIVSARFHFGSYLPWRHPWEDYRVGYGARSDLGGGVILDAIHELDCALWLFGIPTQVYCVAGKFSDLEIDVEDVAELILSYSKHVVSIHLDYVQRPHQRWCEIIGTKGQIQGDLISRTLRLYDGDKRQWHIHEPCCSADEVYIFEMQHFLGCIDGDARPAVDGYVATQSLLMAEAAKESIRSGLPVPLDLSSLERMTHEKRTR